MRGFAHPEQQEMIARTRNYLHYLERDLDARIVAPAPAVGEFLQGYATDAERERVSMALSRRFRVLPFDLSASLLAARIARDLEGARPPPPEGFVGHRQEFKVDVQIAAIALRANAIMLVTHDLADFAVMSLGTMEVRLVPDGLMGEQLELIPTH